MSSSRALPLPYSDGRGRSNDALTKMIRDGHGYSETDLRLEKDLASWPDWLFPPADLQIKQRNHWIAAVRSRDPKWFQPCHVAHLREYVLALDDLQKAGDYYRANRQDMKANTRLNMAVNRLK